MPATNDQSSPVVDLADEQPPRRSNEMSGGRTIAADISMPRIGEVQLPYVVRRLDHRRLEEERQERAGEQHDDEGATGAISPSMNDQWSGKISRPSSLTEAGEARALVDVVRRRRRRSGRRGASSRPSAPWRLRDESCGW